MGSGSSVGDGRRRTAGWRLWRYATTLCLLIGGVGAFTVGAGRRPPPAFADGPAACTSGPPPFPEHGFCATYDGDNTWYGSYGPGFPTPLGWGFCANPPASGGGYPAPAYGYAAGGAPAGADLSRVNALGFAFSQAQAFDWWNGDPGQFTSDQAAAAGKILYDSVVWGTPVPSMDPGVLAAFADLSNWLDQAQGATGTPELSVGLIGGGTTITTSALDDIHLQFPGSGAPLVGLAVLLSVTNGTFDGPSGPTSIGAGTDGGGNVVVPVYADGPNPVTVTVSTLTQVGQIGLGFWHPTSIEPSAQFIAAFAGPTSLQASQQFASPGQPNLSGTISVRKAGNDEAYVGLAGAVFDVMQGPQVVAQLTTDSSGSAGPTPSLPVGSYVVHEATPPPGYQTAPDQSVTVAANLDTEVDFTGSNEDLVSPAALTLHKVDAQGDAPLAGAVFDVRYSTAGDGVYDQDLGPCTTASDGQCAPPGNDGTGLLPGNYLVTEVSPPPGYSLDPSTSSQAVTLTPGEDAALTFSDLQLGSIQVYKTGDDLAYDAIAGATFTVSGPEPAATAVGTLTVGTDGYSNVLGGLVPGSYVLTETQPPAGYEPVSPITVAVAGGHATTVVDVLDHVQPATLRLLKVDRQTGSPLAGAVFDVRYATQDDGQYDEDLGTCTTDGSGTCAPTGNDGHAALLPGEYEVTETSPPPGYVLDPATSVQTIDLGAGEVGSLTFTDPLLVAATFQKVAVGNVNPSLVGLAGAVIEVRAGDVDGPVVASCTTTAAGACSTAAVLVASQTYCWVETAAPAGLAAGATGCFVAADAQASQPITVTDAGEFVGIQAKKVDAADPAATLPGAVFDLYRVDGGQGPGSVPPAPADARPEPGETWVARATTGADGIATFPLEFPGYAYCVVEHLAPDDFLPDSGQTCTPVLAGSPAAAPSITTVTVADTRATITLEAHKFNASQPDTGVPGATYDLYAEGPPPSGMTIAPPPGDAAAIPGDTWVARGTTDGSGNLSFSVPAGFAWCLKEVSSPPDFILDPAIHCTAVLAASSAGTQSTLAIPEAAALVHVSAHKYNALDPDTSIAGATYELVARTAALPGYMVSPPPRGATVPAGDTFWALGVSDGNGTLAWAVPAGYSWCVHEVAAPAGYQPDPAFHCTAVITADSPGTAATLALPEFPLTPTLAFTGAPLSWLVGGGLVLVLGGVSTSALGRRGRRAVRPADAVAPPAPRPHDARAAGIRIVRAIRSTCRRRKPAPPPE